MYFTTPWKTYHTSEMDQFAVGGPSDPVVYVAQDRTCVFVQTPAEVVAGDAHRAGPREIATLWDRQRIVALLAVCKVTDSNSPNGANPGYRGSGG